MPSCSCKASPTIGSHELSLPLAAVAQGDLQFGGIADYMVVGQYVALGIDDRARSYSLPWNRIEEEVPLDHHAGDIHHPFLDKSEVLSILRHDRAPEP